jgi:hypothetical protein
MRSRATFIEKLTEIQQRRTGISCYGLQPASTTTDGSHALHLMQLGKAHNEHLRHEPCLAE